MDIALLLVVLLILIVVWRYGHAFVVEAKKREFRDAVNAQSIETLVQRSSQQITDALEKIRADLYRLTSDFGSLRSDLEYFEKHNIVDLAGRFDILDGIAGELQDIRGELSSIKTEVKAISHHPVFSQPTLDD